MLLLIVIWIAAGLTKLLALDTFKQVVINHSVLPFWAIRWAWAVPALEVFAGVLLIVAGGSSKRVALHRWAAALSAGLLAAFIVYVAAVPEHVFQEVGCGCEGLGILSRLMDRPPRSAVIGLDGALLAASAWLWFRPRVCGSEVQK